MPKRKDFLMNEEILNTSGDQAFYMGAENAKIESAEKSAETGGHRFDIYRNCLKFKKTEINFTEPAVTG